MKPTLQIQIGTHRFKVRVDEKEKAAMLAAAKKVERMLGEMRRNQVADGERAAIMVALQLANGEGAAEAPELAGDDLARLEATLDEALASLG